MTSLFEGTQGACGTIYSTTYLTPFMSLTAMSNLTRILSTFFY